jgi:carboxypeptidase family protein
VRRSLLVLALAAAASASATPATPADVLVRFELNDALVKGRALPGVEVSVARASGGGPAAAGRTGPDGRFEARLPPGSYEIAYRLAGYVPYTSEATEIREDGQLVTVSLSPMVEATSAAARDVRVILNWGSRKDQVRDADSHLACACAAADRHVYFRNRTHQGQGHKVELDVDDTDWGGPETITITQPARGDYSYWVHDYSGPPALLGASDLVVRVLVGSEPLGEFRVFKGLKARVWRPFKAVRVAADGSASVVRWTEDQIAEGQDLVRPPEQDPDPLPGLPHWLVSAACPIAALVIGLVIARRFPRRHHRRR